MLRALHWETTKARHQVVLIYSAACVRGMLSGLERSGDEGTLQAGGL